MPEILPSPKVPTPDDDEPKTDPHVKMSNLRTRIFVLIASGGFSAVSLAGIAIAYEHLRGVAHAAGSEGAELRVAPLDAGLAETRARVAILEQQTTQTRQDVHEARGELRDLYKAVMEGRRSERLEHALPPLDGGAHP